MFADAASFLVSAGALVSIRAREPQRAHDQAGSALSAAIGEGLRLVLHDPYLRVLALFTAIGNLGLAGYLTLDIVFLARDVGVSAAVIGASVAVLSVGGILGAMAPGRLVRRLGTARALLVTVLVTYPFGLLVPLTSPGAGLALLIIGYLVIGAGLTTGSIIVTSFRQTYCPAGMLGRVTASMRFLVQGAVPLGAVLAGVLGNNLGNRTTLWIAAGALLLAAATLCCASPLRQHRALPTALASDGIRHKATSARPR